MVERRTFIGFMVQRLQIGWVCGLNKSRRGKDCELKNYHASGNPNLLDRMRVNCWASPGPYRRAMQDGEAPRGGRAQDHTGGPYKTERDQRGSEKENRIRRRRKEEEQKEKSKNHSQRYVKKFKLRPGMKQRFR